MPDSTDPLTQVPPALAHDFPSAAGMIAIFVRFRQREDEANIDQQGLKTGSEPGHHAMHHGGMNRRRRFSTVPSDQPGLDQTGTSRFRHNCHSDRW